MGGGGIIHQAKALLDAAQDPSLYDVMSPHHQHKVDEIAAKGPAGWTHEDCEELIHALKYAVSHYE